MKAETTRSRFCRHAPTLQAPDPRGYGTVAGSRPAHHQV